MGLLLTCPSPPEVPVDRTDGEPALRIAQDLNRLACQGAQLPRCQHQNELQAVGDDRIGPPLGPCSHVAAESLGGLGDKRLTGASRHSLSYRPPFHFSELAI